MSVNLPPTDNWLDEGCNLSQVWIAVQPPLMQKFYVFNAYPKSWDTRTTFQSYKYGLKDTINRSYNQYLQFEPKSLSSSSSLIYCFLAFFTTLFVHHHIKSPKAFIDCSKCLIIYFLQKRKQNLCSLYLHLHYYPIIRIFTLAGPPFSLHSQHSLPDLSSKAYVVKNSSPKN